MRSMRPGFLTSLIISVFPEARNGRTSFSRGCGIRMTTSLTHPTNDQRNFALGWTHFVMCQQLGGGSPSEFFEFFGQLARDTELPVGHQPGASSQRFQNSIRRFEKNRGRFAFHRGAQFTFPLSAFHGQETAEAKRVSRQTGAN